MGDLKCGHTVLDPNCKFCKELQKKWYGKTGIDDIEDSHGNIKEPDRRTKAFHSGRKTDVTAQPKESYTNEDIIANQETIRDFFLNLDTYLTHNKVPTVERKAMEMYSAGLPIKDILKALKITEIKFHRILWKYEAIIKGER